MTRQSEFGHGYATCLRQFTFHDKRLEGMLAFYGEMARRRPDLFSENHAVEMWANGASDHLYELVHPRRGVPLKEWRRAKALQTRALDVGHGFGATSKSTPSEVRQLVADANALLADLGSRGFAVGSLEDVMATDRKLGLAPLRGDWSCSADIEYLP